MLCEYAYVRNSFVKPLPSAQGSMTSNLSREHSPSIQSTPIDAEHQTAAFRGASHAFAQIPDALKSLPKTYSGTNGALAAASSVGLGRRKEERPFDGAYPNGLRAVRPVVNEPQKYGNIGTRDFVRHTSQSRGQSPSQVAALLAASRATPVRAVSNSLRPTSRRPSPLQSMEDLNLSSPTGSLLPTDTASLVKHFESQQTQKAAPITHSVRYVNKPAPPIASPTPVRPVQGSTSTASISLRNFPPTYGQKREEITSKTPSQIAATATAAKLSGPPRQVGGLTKGPVPAKSTPRLVPDPPALRQIRKGPSLVGSQERAGGSMLSNMDSTERFLDGVAADLRTRSEKSPGRPVLLTRRSEPVAVNIARPSKSVSRPSLPSYQTFDKRYPDHERSGGKHTQSSDNFIPQMTVDSLANAIIASSLASSRAPSPTKPPPLPPPRRHGKHSLFHHHHSQEDSRTPSPAKGMRLTMREPLKSDDEDDFRKHRSHRVRKHPNKHHEGDRKRYRNQVTERERKRYEGVWAANKGLLDVKPSTAIINIVVRDIWKRSRLPDDVLGEVWDLVDTQGNGKLERDEFVVGMFLIDQRLKGNKLPFKVSDSIWSSVRRLSGINVPRNRR